MKENKKHQTSNQHSETEKISSDRKHESPFKKEAVNEQTGETPDEEAAAEQQRKDALTERD